MNAFIGANNSGKSNILRALDLVLGATYPGARSFEDSDFHNNNRKDPITIEARFSRPLAANPQIQGFRLEYDGSDSSFLGTDDKGNVQTYYSGGREIKVSNQMKDEVGLMYLPLDRQAYDQIRPTQWTIYGKLLKHITASISNPTREKFKTDVDDCFKRDIGPSIVTLEKEIDKHVSDQTGLGIQLKLSFVEVADVLKNLRPHLTDTSNQLNHSMDVEDEGAGVQSAVAVAIARAYANIVKQPLILAIEEPELYLHPHACRHFYGILKDMSRNGVQVIYATHERCFVNAADYTNIHMVRKVQGHTEVLSGARMTHNADPIRMASKLCEELNEVFFARKVVLVEGPEDRIACKLALEKMNVQLDRMDVSIIDCGGISGIEPLAKILKGFKIDVIALVDEDPGNRTTAKHTSGIEAAIGSGNVIKQMPNLEGLFGLQSLTKDKALREIPGLLTTIPVPSVYNQVQKAIS